MAEIGKRGWAGLGGYKGCHSPLGAWEEKLPLSLSLSLCFLDGTGQIVRSKLRVITAISTEKKLLRLWWNVSDSKDTSLKQLPGIHCTKIHGGNIPQCHAKNVMLTAKKAHRESFWRLVQFFIKGGCGKLVGALNCDSQGGKRVKKI